MKKIEEARKALDESVMKIVDPEKDRDFFKKVHQTMKYAGVMKRNMNKKGIRRAKAVCPYCSGFWHAHISTYNGHMHMRCDGDCGTFMME